MAGRNLAQASNVCVWLASDGDDCSPIDGYEAFYQELQQPQSTCQVHRFRDRRHEELHDVLWSQATMLGKSKKNKGHPLRVAEKALWRELEDWLCRNGPPPAAQEYPTTVG